MTHRGHGVLALAAGFFWSWVQSKVHASVKSAQITQLQPKRIEFLGGV